MKLHIRVFVAVLATTLFAVASPNANSQVDTPTENSYTDSVEGVGPYFYRIEVHQ